MSIASHGSLAVAPQKASTDSLHSSSSQDPSFFKSLSSKSFLVVTQRDGKVEKSEWSFPPIDALGHHDPRCLCVACRRRRNRQP